MSGKNSEIPTKSREAIDLGEFRFSIDSNELYDADGSSIRLRRQSTDVLSYLASRAGQIVSKNELIETVWPETFVTDDSLGQCIVDIRRALNDNDHTLILTFPKKGYMLVPTEFGEDVGDGATATNGNRTRYIAFTAVFVVLLALLVSQVWWPEPDGGDTAALPLPTEPSVIVLPFENHSEDGDLDYIAAGFSTSIRTQLSKFPQLFVIAGSTSVTFKDGPGTARGIGRELGVRYILDGNLRKVGNSLVVSAELIEAESERTAWAEQYDISNDTPLSAQARLVQEIVGTLNAVVGEEELASVRSAQTDSPRAYDLFIRAEAATALVSQAGRAEALRLLNEAIEIDPNYLDAHFELSGRYLGLFRFGGTDDPVEAVRLSRSHAERALEISRSDYRGHFRLGMISLFADHNHELAFASFQRALKDNPNDADVLYNMGFLRSLMGEPEEAIEWNEKAKRINPRYPGWYNFNAAQSRFFVGDYDEAENLARMGIAEYPTSLAPRRILIATLVEAGRLADAQTEVVQYLEISPAFRLSSFRNTPFQHEADRDRYYGALMAAGIPE